MSRSSELVGRRDAIVPRGLGRIHPDVAVVSARGAILTDADGRELIDFAGGIGVMTVGHCHPDVVAAIGSQAGALLHTCIHVACYEPYVGLCEKLCSLFPHGDRTKAFLANTGAEAVENAVKIARQATGRQAVICFTEAFHGRTLMAMSLTSKVGYKIGCGPFAPEVFRLPFPNRYRYGDGLDEAAFVERELGRFRQALVHTVPPEHVAAVIVEPVQGEGGFVPAPLDYLRGLRDICTEHGIMLIVDEVQTGFCRTGRWAAYQHAGITPDLSTWAKAMGGGTVISAVLGRAEVMDAARPGTLGGTYGGNPVSCAAALAAIGVMERENLPARAEAIGRRIRPRFEALGQRFPDRIGWVRGVGAMIAMDFARDGDPNRTDGPLCAALIKACLGRGLLVIPAGSYGNMIRVLCPLVITDEQLDRGLSIIDEELCRILSAPAGAPRDAAAAVSRA